MILRELKIRLNKQLKSCYFYTQVTPVQQKGQYMKDTIKEITKQVIKNIAYPIGLLTGICITIAVIRLFL